MQRGKRKTWITGEESTGIFCIIHSGRHVYCTGRICDIYSWAHLTAAGCTITKPIMAFAFASALSLVVMAGAELFTGNNFVMAAGSFMGQVSWANTVKVWVVCYLGNLVGALLGAVMFVAAGVPTGTVGEFFANTAATKMGGAAGQLFVKGIMCNLMVCLAVWCCTKMKTESGKLIMIFWCIFIFMVCGFEHSIANMSVMAIGLMSPNGVAGLTIAGYFHNLLWVNTWKYYWWQHLCCTAVLFNPKEIKGQLPYIWIPYKSGASAILSVPRLLYVYRYVRIYFICF